MSETFKNKLASLISSYDTNDGAPLSKFQSILHSKRSNEPEICLNKSTFFNLSKKYLQKR